MYSIHPMLPAALAPLAFAAAALAAPVPLPQDGEEKFVAVHAGRLILGTGEEKEGVTILIRDGKIDAVGENIELPFPCEVIDARSMTVMPGLIHVASRLGLMNYNRNGQRADRTVRDEFLPEPKAYEDAREAGFTTLALEPPGSSGVPGRALVIRTADVGGGWIVDDDNYLKLNLTRPGPDRKVIAGALKQAKGDIDKREKARADWEKKQKEAEEAAKKKAEEEKKKEEGKENGKAAQDPPKPEEKKAEAPKAPEFKPPAIAPTSQPFVDLVEKKEGSFGLVRLGGASTYLHFLKAIEGYEFPYHLVGNNQGGGGGFIFRDSDLHFVAEQMAENEELLVLFPTLTNEPYTINRINLAKEMVAAGVRVALSPSSDASRDLETLLAQVAKVVKGGLEPKYAFQALGAHAAEAIGMKDRLGSVEKGKDGNLLILSGDPFAVDTRVERVLIEGVTVHQHEE